MLDLTGTNPKGLPPMLYGTPTISVAIGERTFSTWTNTLDAAIAAFEPATTEELTSFAEERTGLDFTGVTDRVALLVVIADHEGF
jgi:hypothetical protein